MPNKEIQEFNEKLRKGLELAESLLFTQYFLQFCARYEKMIDNGTDI